MSRKNRTLLASSIIAAVTGVIFYRAAFQHQPLPISTPGKPINKAESEPLSIPSQPWKDDASAALVLNPWDHHKPLTAEERREFEGAEAQIRKFLSWGKMDPEAVPAFRQTLFKIGDRAVADLARGLSQITREHLQDRAAAESVVQKIDELAYFANSSNPLAADCIAALARRPVEWNEAGELPNPVEANITFELFDIHARTRPREAAEFIKGIDKKNRTAYFTHYAYGRKLAGKTLEDIDLELRAVFGSPELALK